MASKKLSGNKKNFFLNLFKCPWCKNLKTEKKVKLQKIILRFAIAGIILVSLLYFFLSFAIVAVVNGRPIFRWTLIKNLEQQGGAQVLSDLITRSLIYQAVQKENVSISEEEINQQLDQIKQTLESQGQSLEAVLKERGLTESNVKKDIELQKLAEKMAAKDVTISDQELNDYLEANKSLSEGKEVTAEEKETMKQQLLSKKINQAIQSWLTKIKEEAKIIYWQKSLKPV